MSQPVAERPRQRRARSWEELAAAAEGLVHALRNPLFALRLDLHTLRTSLKKPASTSEPKMTAEVTGILKACEDRLDFAEQLLAGLAT